MNNQDKKWLEGKIETLNIIISNMKLEVSGSSEIMYLDNFVKEIKKKINK